MADNVAVTAGTGTTIAADEVVDGTLGTVKVQYVKIMDGTLDGTTKAAVGSGGLKVQLFDGTTAFPILAGSSGAPAASAPAIAVSVRDNNANGPALPASSAPVTAVAGGVEYETVAASQTDQALGATGASGDYLESLLCVVATAATSQVQIKDGAGSAITVLPNAVGAGVGTYPIPIGLVSTSGAWKVTTAAGVSVIATGNFT